MTEIFYRDAAAGDGPVLGGIARATFIQSFGHLYSLADLGNFMAAYTDAAYTAEVTNPDVAVRFAELVPGVPIGFCKISSLKLPAPGAAAHAAELRQLYLYTPWFGLKIADVLTDWAKDQARQRGAPELWLSVFSENARARRFYARHGFDEVAPYHFMVGTQADEDILCRARL